MPRSGRVRGSSPAELFLLLAAAIAVAASSTCAYALISSLTRHDRLTRAVLPIADSRAGSRGKLTLADRMACEARAQALNSYRVLPRAEGNPYFLRTTTADSPSAIVPVEPARPSLAPWRFRYFATYLDVGQIDLNSRTAIITFTVLGFAPPARYGSPLGFPRGTNLSLNVLSRTSGASVSPLGQDLQAGGFARISQKVALAGSSSTYPDDSYVVDFAAVSILADIPGQPEAIYTLDVAPVSLPSSGDNQARLQADPGFVLILSDGEQCGVEPALVFTRNDGRLFVWIMCAVPLVLLILMLRSILYARGRPRRDGSSVEPIIAVEAAVVFLSILPLRTVLVPSGVSGVTRVDYALGLQIGLLVLVLVLQSLRLPRRAPTRRDPDSH